VVSVRTSITAIESNEWRSTQKAQHNWSLWSTMA
jgi:hypothetical protein